MAKRRLKSIEDIRRYLAHLIHEIEAGTMDATKGGRLAYITSILIRAVEGSELERRIAALEKAILREDKREEKFAQPGL
jgi:hypothetical protein